MTDRARDAGVSVGSNRNGDAARLRSRQIVVQRQGFRVPLARQLKCWASAALADHHGAAVVTLRIVAAAEMQQLNLQYRDKDYATNVLAFPLPLSTSLSMPSAQASVAGRRVADSTLRGDVVICAPVVVAEATAQGKDSAAHWAHLTVHGVLHLRGFDHESAADAAVMEAREISVLARLGVPNPYVLAAETVAASSKSTGKR